MSAFIPHNLSPTGCRGRDAFTGDQSHEFTIWKLRLVRGHFGPLLSPKQTEKEAAPLSDVIHPSGNATAL